MNVLISHVFSDENKGDAALLSVLIKDIGRVFNAPHITILTMDDIDHGELFEKTPVQNSFMYYAINRYRNRFLKLVYSFFIMGITLVWAYVYRFTKKSIPLPKNLRTLTDLYKNADLIVPVGGGYLRGKPGLISTVLLLLLLHPLVMARIIKKPTINYAQSIGPFGNKFQEFVAASVLKKVDRIFVREDVSLKLLTRMGITGNVVRSIDSGFLFSTDIKRDLRKELSIPKEKLLVGITVRAWLKNEAQTKYEKAIALCADHIIERYNAAIIFIPQVTAIHHRDDDREISRRVYGYMHQQQGAYRMDDMYDHTTIKAIYNNLDYTIGTRFHSVIFSLTSHVPAIAIEYEHKTTGIMHDLDLDKWVIKMEEVTTEKLDVLFSALMAEHEAYRNHLLSVLPAYVEQANELPVLMKQAYEGHAAKAN